MTNPKVSTTVSLVGERPRQDRRERKMRAWPVTDGVPECPNGSTVATPEEKR